MNLQSKSYKVTFRTVTPIYFGDAWGRNALALRASSIMGCLRFWFEVICYFAGITTNADYKIVGQNKNVVLKADLNQEEFQDRQIKHLIGGNLLSIEESIDRALAEMDIPLPARIFGCTGWQGLIKIGEVKTFPFKNTKFTYSKIGIPKDRSIDEVLLNGKCPKKSDENYSVHFFPGSPFQGNFEINFITTPQIAECILFPLLMFVEKYGFLGGGWNSGFGRVTASFSETSKDYDTYKDYAEFVNTPVRYADLVNKIPKKEDLWEDRKNINTINLYQCKIDGNKEDILKELIRQKVYLRRKINDKNECHLVFGTTKSPPEKKLLPQGSKILPWIYEPNGDKSKRQCGFISIAGILNIGP